MGKGSQPLEEQAAAVAELMQLEERATLGALDDAQRSRWRELCVLLAGDEPSSERRRAFRVRVARAAKVRAGEEQLDGSVTSLSVGGVFIELAAATDDLVGREIEVELNLPVERTRRLRCRAVVCWVADPSGPVPAGVGAKFVGLSVEDKRTILGHCHQRLLGLVEISTHKYRFFFEHSADVAILVDARGAVREINQHGAALLGTTCEDLVARPLEALFASDSRADIRSALGSLGEEREARLPARLACSNNRHVPVDVRLVSLAVNGLAMGAVVVAHDLADRQFVAAQQRELERRLFQADKLATIGQIAAGIAHDINNPLAYIHANLCLLAEHVAPIRRALRAYAALHVTGDDPPELLAQIASEVDELVQDTLEGSARIRDIVRELRDFSGVESEGRVRIELNKVVETSIRVVKNLIKHRAALECELADGLPVTYGNFGRLTQVLLNLLTNAAQSFDEADVTRNRIVVRTSFEEEKLVIEVTDNGRGIDPATLDHIFEPFFSTRRDVGGTGLGLSIVHENVEALGGALSVQSSPGEGATFVVRFPPRVASRPWQPPSDEPVPAAEGLARILIIDDEPALLRSWRRLLGRRYHVTITTSPIEALDLVNRHPYQAVVCDVMIPEMSGPAFHERLSRLRPELGQKLFFVTGGTFSAREERALLDRGRPVLRKPVEPEALLRAIAESVAQ